MAVVRIPDKQRELTEVGAIQDCLAPLGVTYQRWEPSQPVAADAPSSEILAAYSAEIEALKQQGGYVTADVVDLKPTTEGLDGLLAKFRREHWHDEDEVRFTIKGRGVFYLRDQQGGDVLEVEVGPGDLLTVPQGTWHWFTLCTDQTIRCIRLFQDPSGWAPQYTESGIDGGYQPVCLSARDVPAS